MIVLFFQLIHSDTSAGQTEISLLSNPSARMFSASTATGSRMEDNAWRLPWKLLMRTALVRQNGTEQSIRSAKSIDKTQTPANAYKAFYFIHSS